MFPQHFFLAFFSGVMKLREMARKNPIPARELAIGARVMKLRRLAKMSRTGLAYRLGSIDSSLIARIELGRVPLKYETAQTLLGMLGDGKVNPLWLADGKDPMLLSRFFGFAMPAAADLGFKDTDAFSKIMDRFKGELETLILAPEQWDLPKPWLRAQLNWVKWNIEGICQSLAHWQRILNVLREKLGILDYEEEGVGAGGKKELTAAATNVNLSSVKAQMPQLLARLAKATEPAGKMSALARFLPAPLSSVSRWVNGKRKPGTETTLRLLHWVEQEEAKTKS